MEYQFKLDGLECASCATKMARDINNLDGVNLATIDFATKKLTIRTEQNIKNILLAAQKIIKRYEFTTQIRVFN